MNKGYINKNKDDKQIRIIVINLNGINPNNMKKSNTSQRASKN